MQAPDHEIAIVGGGLAGLALAIELRLLGHDVLLVERKAYPFHRVCGEYISLESYPYLERLGIPLSSWDLPILKQLRVTAPSGTSVRTALPLGGFGISRYKLDHAMAERAVDLGVKLLTNTTVQAIRPDGAVDLLQLADGTTIRAQWAVNASGKRSVLDQFWQRDYLKADDKSAYANYVGIKWHLKADLPRDLIELHNFKDGYAGISAVEGDDYCFCYLTTAANLRRADNSIDQLERTVLQQNPVLDQYLSRYAKSWAKPLAISQVSFAAKSRVEHTTLQLGDAAGLIAPLCGNGMSMALRGANLLTPLIDQHLKGQLTKAEAIRQYEKVWQAHFRTRLFVGRQIQALFGHPVQTELVVRLFKTMPFMLRPLISLTHGQPF